MERHELAVSGESAEHGEVVEQSVGRGTGGWASARARYRRLFAGGALRRGVAAPGQFVPTFRRQHRVKRARLSPGAGENGFAHQPAGILEGNQRQEETAILAGQAGMLRREVDRLGPTRV